MINLEAVPVDAIPTPDDILYMIAVKKAELDALRIALHSVVAYRREYLTKAKDGRADDATTRQ